MLKSLPFLFCAAMLYSCGKNTPRFERLDAEFTGIHFNNEIIEQDSFNVMQLEYMYNGGGVGVVDLNNDGLQDLVFVGNKVLTRIYLNLGGFKFQDITENFEGLSNAFWLNGVAVVDINADGWNDIYLTSNISFDSLNGKNQLWVNQGLGDDGLPHFIEMAMQYGIDDIGYSIHSAFFDFDLDGDLDLYAMNNIVNDKVPTNYRPKIVDGTAVNNDKLFRNEGDGRFVDISKEAGIIHEGFGLGLAIGDFNKDGYPDVYVANDYIANDLFYINQGDGTFVNEAPRYLSYQSRFSMGCDISDINNDGNLDIMTLDMFPEQYFRKKQTINGNSYHIYNMNQLYGYETQYVRNMLQLHNGFLDGQMLPFSEVGQMLGIYQTEWSWSPLFADFDNDGDRDLFITNGFPRDLTDKDFTIFKAKMYGFLAGDEDILPRIPEVKVSNYAFENLGDYKFINRAKEWGLDIPSYSNGAVFVDLDNDGDLDYVTNNINDKAFVYRNRSIEDAKDAVNFLRIDLKGSGKNTLAIGAKVELWSKGQLQYLEHHLSRGYMSSVDPVIHFGLGNAAVVDSVRVIWPTGRSTTFLTNVSSNQTLVLRESEAMAFSNALNPPNTRGTLFSNASGEIDYLHVQEDFIDFFMMQKIIQHKFSQIGPCMAKGDLDGDGIDDLYIGGSSDAPAAVFLNKGNHFEKVEIPGLTGARQCLESDAIILDIDGDGDNDVVVVAGGYANERESDYQHFIYLNQGGIFVKMELPVPPFPASVVRPFDFDKDGDIDLFIGARVKRGNFPKAPASFLLINNKGKFSSDRVLSFDLGMVTDAVWSDYNGDGWVDLVVTREWNSVAILENKNGREFKPVVNKAIDGMHGFWSAIAAADLDGDGDDDYIIGNLGENHRFHVSEKYPMRLYPVDVDRDGSIDPITAAFWKDKDGVMQEYPVNYLDEMASQSEFFRKKFSSYTDFSFYTMGNILDKSAFSDANRFWVNSSSSYVLWNEGKRFKWERLPSEVQTSPVKKILVRDFNGDGRLDVIFAGNDYSYDVSTGKYDANKGIILLGKSDRGFDVLPPSKSGLILNGQVESLLYFEGDTSWLVAGINRNKVEVFKQVLNRQSGRK